MFREKLDVRISTNGGATIRNGVEYFSSDQCKENPSDSVTIHLGINTILKHQHANQNDVVNMVMRDYIDLISAAKRRFPNVKQINLSEIFTLGGSKRSSAQKRDALNTTIDIVNDHLASYAAEDPLLSTIRHQRINNNTQIHR